MHRAISLANIKNSNHQVISLSNYFFVYLWRNLRPTTLIRLRCHLFGGAMKRLLGLLLLLSVFQSTFPQGQPKASPTPATQASNKADPPATTSGPCAVDYYRNSSGVCVHRPVKTQNTSVPNRATAQCRDGSYSFSQHRRGTCSRHGGVAKWL
jgi:hypothetical protein